MSGLNKKSFGLPLSACICYVLRQEKQKRQSKKGKIVEKQNGATKSKHFAIRQNVQKHTGKEALKLTDSCNFSLENIVVIDYMLYVTINLMLLSLYS